MTPIDPSALIMRLLRALWSCVQSKSELLIDSQRSRISSGDYRVGVVDRVTKGATVGLLLTLINVCTAHAVDLSVSNVSLLEESHSGSITVEPGEEFTVWARANKVGYGYWSSARLVFVRSNDLSISLFDRRLVYASLSYSSMGGNTYYHSYMLWDYDARAPNEPGTYYYGACIATTFDTTYFDSNISNNCGTYLDVIAVTVQSAPPNIVVGQLSAPLRRGGSREIVFTNQGVWHVGSVSEPWIDVEISNTGRGASPSTGGWLYRSADEIFDIDADETVSFELIPMLDEGESTTVTFHRTYLPETPGTYYYAVRVTPVPNEQITSDNWNSQSNNVKITVQFPPDLAATQFLVEGGTVLYATPGIRLVKVTATTTNVGRGRSVQVPAEEHLIYHRSPASSGYTALGVQLGAIGPLAPNSSQSFTGAIPVPNELGEHRYVYGILSDGLESDACTNNVSDEVVIHVVPELPNLTISGVTANNAGDGSVSVVPSATLRFDATVTNIATSAAPVPETLRLVLLELRPGQEASVVARGDPVTRRLSSRATQQMVLTTTSAQEVGTYAYSLCAISDIDDANFESNCQLITVTVEARLLQPPDLAIEQIQINDMLDLSLTVEPGTPLELAVSIRNVAVANSQSPRRLTVTATIVDPDGERHRLGVATDDVASSNGLGAHQSAQVVVRGTAPTELGIYTVQLCVTGDIEESGATSENDCSMPVQITISQSSLTVTLQLNKVQLSEDDEPSDVTVTAILTNTTVARFVPTTVNVSVAGGTAVTGTDYSVVTPASLVIPAGSLSGAITIRLAPIEDNIVEEDKTVLILGQAAGDTVVPVTVTIVDDDVPPQSIMLRAHPEVIQEDQGSQVVVLTVSFPAGSSVLTMATSVSVSIQNNDGTLANVLQMVSNWVVTIDAFATSASQEVRLTPVDNDVASAGVTVTLGGIAAGFVVIPVRMTIANDDLAPPSELRAASEEKAIQLMWMPPQIESTTPVTGYVVEALLAGGVSWVQLATIDSGSALSYRHTGLGDGQTVSYRLTSTGEDQESGPTVTITATTRILKPSPPQFVTAIGSRNRVVITWEPPVSDGGSAVTGYQIESSSDSSTWLVQDIARLDVAGKYTHRDLPDNQLLYYRVAAVNVAGVGTASRIASAYTSAPYTASLVADTNLDGRITSDDAIVLYFALTQQRLLGDGSSGGQPSLRRAILSTHIGGLEEPNDHDFRNLLSTAHEFSILPRHDQLDVNQSGSVNEEDAQIIYFALALRELLGDGNRGGFQAYRAYLLSNLVSSEPDQASDDALKATLRRVNDLLDATYSED